MPPKPQTFKTPDGKEFATRVEWRDYMLATFYSYKNINNAPQPMVKEPGSIDGQIFDIADCSNSTLVILDVTEQVQIDQCTNCRIFIGACTSSLFIRNCKDCTFYVATRQLRLRDVTQSSFYVFSQSEVHIEFSNTLRFAPFNGGYQEHAQHLQRANLNLEYNLWYDIYDHNDPGKTHENWSLIPESEYEAPWFPQGVAVELAIPRTKAGSVHRTDENATGESFGMKQLEEDAKKLKVAASAAAVVSSAPAPSATITPPPAPATKVATVTLTVSPAEAIQQVVEAFLGRATNTLSNDFHLIQPTGEVLTKEDLVNTPLNAMQLIQVDDIKYAISQDLAFATFLAQELNVKGKLTLYLYTGVFEKVADSWKLAHAQKSGALAV